MLKNIVTISLTLFIIAVVAVLGLAVFSGQNTNPQTGGVSLNNNNSSGQKTTTTPPKTPVNPAPNPKPVQPPVINIGDGGESDGEDGDSGTIPVPVPTPAPTPAPTPVPTPTPTPIPTPTPAPTGITAAQVATHNSVDDCWLIVNNKVYNVTNLIPIHSGGPGQIIPYCGKDASVAFNTMNGRGGHSSSAQNILNSYYVGNLN